MNTLRKTLFSVMFFIMAVSCRAYDVQIDGIYYDIDGVTASVEGCSYDQTEVVVPSYIVVEKIKYSVTSIGELAFIGCTSLSAIEIPESVTSIGDDTFYGCVNLRSVTIPNSVTSIGESAFRDCTSLTSIIIPSSVTSIGDDTFMNCVNLRSVTIPNSVTSIGRYAFYGCISLSHIEIPESVTYIGGSAFEDCYVLENNLHSSIELPGLTIVDEETDGLLIKEGSLVRCRSWVDAAIIPSKVTIICEGAFHNCTNLTSVIIPNGVASICKSAFSFCPNLTSVTLPNSIERIEKNSFMLCSSLKSVTIQDSPTGIGNYAFRNCYSLSSFIIPKSVKYFPMSFEGCTFRPLVIYGTGYNYYSALMGLKSSSVIFAHKSELSEIRRNFSGKVFSLDDPFYLDDINIHCKDMSFKMFENPYYESSVTRTCVKVGSMEVTPDENGIYHVVGLKSDTKYPVTVLYQTEGVEKEFTFYITTNKMDVYLEMSELHQTSIVINRVYGKSGDDSFGTCGVMFNGKTYEYTEGTPIKFEGLKPNTSYSMTIYAYYGEEIVSKTQRLTTEGMYPNVSIVHNGPTTLLLSGSCEEKDAHVLETGFVGYGTGNRVSLTGLTPQSTTSITYYVKTVEGGYEEHTASFTTPALELTTLQPKCVSSTCAIVAATTNISEEEPSVGFQWRKYDAPESLKSSEGYAAVYNGQLEGYIKNLQSAFYYNVRAFYKASDGTYYYGDWVTFDPSDFSFFEPTVHTYSAENVTENSARIKAYVLAGTDEILQQGFEYWSYGAAASGKKSAPTPLAPSAEDHVTTVVSTGQVMTANLTDLLPGTTYCCRAFVKTSAGTAYGEEQTFTTLGYPTGIEVVEGTFTGEPEVMGYYDMSGRRLSVPCRGVNIVRYSDGTSRKILVK